jgi:carboxylesterase type B
MPFFGGVVYNGEQLVPQGVIFVSYNLRLGVLGFLAHRNSAVEALPDMSDGKRS